MPSSFDNWNTSSDPSVQAADDRTLRLATHPLTQQELDALLRYQETFLTLAEDKTGHEAIAQAHLEALEAAGLSKSEAKDVEQRLALLRSFSGQRWTVSQLRDKLKQLEAQGPEEDELRSRVRTQLARMERTDAFARRYGEESIALLLRHEEKLLALHTRMVRVLSRG
jgi:hypothetical protein